MLYGRSGLSMRFGAVLPSCACLCCSGGPLCPDDRRPAVALQPVRSLSVSERNRFRLHRRPHSHSQGRRMHDVAFRVRVTGLVQGVWFRGWTKREAVRLGLAGWVRNEADGSVCALISGPEPRISEMLRAFWKGPRYSHVESVMHEPAEPSEHDAFRIL